VPSIATHRALIERLATFIAVHDARSFRAAGEAIGRSQPAVTAQINQLERQLGVQLFVRTTRQVSPTLAGRELIDRARRLVAEAETLVRDFLARNELTSGRLALSVSPTVASGLIARALAPFRQEFPAVATSIREDMADAMFAALEAGDVEIGVGPYDAPPTALRFIPVLEQPFFLIAPRGDAIAAGRRPRFQDLADTPLILPSSGTTARRLLTETADRLGVRLQAVAEATEHQTIAAMAAAGLGVTVMPIADRRVLDALGLAATPFADVDIARPVGVLMRKNAELSPAGRAFVQLLSVLPATPEALESNGLRALSEAGAIN